MQPIIGVPILLVNRYSDAFSVENIGMSIGTRVRQARRRVGLTQEELAAKVGMKQSTLSELETGESTGTGSVATIANALGVSALWLETGLGEMKSQDSAVDPADIVRLVSLYGNADARLRKEMMDAVEDLAKGAEVIRERERRDPGRDRRQRVVASKTVSLDKPEPGSDQKRNS